MKCDKCQSIISHGDGDYWSAWQALFNTVEILNSEDKITDQTMELMIDRLMTLKSLVSAADERPEPTNEEGNAHA